MDNKEKISDLLSNALSNIIEAKGLVGHKDSAWAGRAQFIEQLYGQFDEIERRIKDIDLDVQS